MALSPSVARFAGPLTVELEIVVEVATSLQGSDVLVVATSDVEVLATLRQTGANDAAAW